MIKLVLPICKKQAPMVARLVHRFKQFNDTLHRDLTIICPWEDQFEAPDLVKFVKPCFKNTELLVIPDVPEFAEWPMVGNHMFYETAKKLHDTGNTEPWYFFEPDNWPLHPFWLDDIQADFDQAGKPFYGAMNDTRRVNLDTGKSEVQGRHMVGTGIYPADFFERSLALHELTNDPWDIAIQDEIVAVVHDSFLIFHAWNTGKYRRTAEGVIGEDFGPNKGRYGGRPIPPQAVVVHGCKDASLSKIDFDRRDVMV